MKPGYKTTEFWLTFAMETFAVMAALAGGPVTLPGLATAIYSISRGLAKGGVIRGTLGRALTDPSGTVYDPSDRTASGGQ